MLKYMKAHKHLKPGENGTLRLVERFGDTLLCVRVQTANEIDQISDMVMGEAVIDPRRHGRCSDWMLLRATPDLSYQILQ